MKTLCVMDSVSRQNGGIFEAERRLQQCLHAEEGVDVRVIGLVDAHTEEDLPSWSPLAPRALPVRGPQAFGYAPEMSAALSASEADLGYLVGLWKYPALAMKRWSRRKVKPVMIAPHGMLEPWALRHSGWKKKLAGWIFQNAQLGEASCLRALCAAEAASMRAYGLRNPICVIPNGIDLPALEEEERCQDVLYRDRKMLLYLGRLHSKKGLVPLLAAWASEQPRNAEWLLAIAGWDQGGHEAELKKRATDLGLVWKNEGDVLSAETSVQFLGPRFGAAKEECYRSCDAFVLPSFSEGLPMVVLEAWAYGKPVLMTPACNLPEGFRNQAAISMEPEPDKIAESLKVLFSLSEGQLLAMGQSARGLVETRFTWPRMAKEMSAVYRWMLGGGPQPACVEEV
jgi:poly(glycerol-phosphate) alpha-glucosyltransferase